jgi:ribosomal protein S18 acetylase RimI-like enzyme
MKITTATKASPGASPQFQLVPASRFTIEELTRAYNQTRVDYMVPMPMNVIRLTEYIHVYDVDLNYSLVALSSDQILGLGMLGLRPGRTWITRLGVLPVKRRQGVGKALMDMLLVNSETLQSQVITLEVIKNNIPAYNLFVRTGFKDVGELLVLRRPPGPPPHAPSGEPNWIERAEALALLESRRVPQSWITETGSLSNAEDILGLTLDLADGSRGWLVFQQQKFRMFSVSLSRLTLHTEYGDALQLGRSLLAHLHQRYPGLDTHTENISLDDPHLPAFFEMGYLESFRRIEMCRQGAHNHHG